MPRQLPFSPLYDFTAFKPFDFNGRRYQNGDPFPHPDTPEEERPSETLLRKMYEQRRISPTAPDQSRLAPAGPENRAHGAVEDESDGDGAEDEDEASDADTGADADGAGGGDSEGADEDGEADTAQDPDEVERPAQVGALSRVHEGFNRYRVVDEAGTVFGSDLSLTAANKLVKGE